jgi:predicted lipoprotein with Yx(FWY)xxD motif
MHKSMLIPTVLVSVALAACGSSSSGSSSSSSSSQSTAASTVGSASGASVKTMQNASLRATVLVSSHGMTLYHLSGEQNGKFICTTSACVGIWHPLTVASGSTPTGTESLGTVKRPDGTEQVTYKGMPLYTFAQDTSEGDAKGQGLKDVGTWSAVTVSAASGEAPAATSSTPSSSGGGGYAY